MYAAVRAKRLASWASEAGAISPSQKGFIPGEGCLEHAFLMRSMMEDARRSKRPLHVWFDLRNAFGSVPHKLLWFSLRSIGVPDEVVSILMDIYEGSSFQVQTAGGLRARYLRIGESSKAVLSALCHSTWPSRDSFVEFKYPPRGDTPCRRNSRSRPWQMPTIWPLPPLQRRTSLRCWSGWKSFPAGPSSDSMWQSARHYPQHIGVVNRWSCQPPFDSGGGGTVKPPKRGRYGDSLFVLSSEVVLFRRTLFFNNKYLWESI